MFLHDGRYGSVPKQIILKHHFFNKYQRIIKIIQNKKLLSYAWI